jgi:hypothetical protein
VWVLELCDDLDLAPESLGSGRNGDVEVERLDDDAAVECALRREEDARHAPTSELTLDRHTLTE